MLLWTWVATCSRPCAGSLASSFTTSAALLLSLLQAVRVVASVGSGLLKKREDMIPLLQYQTVQLLQQQDAPQLLRCSYVHHKTVASAQEGLYSARHGCWILVLAPGQSALMAQ